MRLYLLLPLPNCAPPLHFSPALQAARLRFSAQQHGASLCGLRDFEPPVLATLGPRQAPLHTPHWFITTRKHGAAQLRATESPFVTAAVQERGGALRWAGASQLTPASRAQPGSEDRSPWRLSPAAGLRGRPAARRARQSGPEGSRPRRPARRASLPPLRGAGPRDSQRERPQGDRRCRGRAANRPH